MKLSDKTKTILFGVLSLTIVLLIVFTSVALIKDLSSEDNKIDSFVEQKIYGTVSEIGSNYVKIKDVDGEEFILFTNDSVEIGDFVSASIKKNNNEIVKDAKLEVVLKKDEASIVINDQDITTTTIVYSEEVSTTTSNYVTNTTRVNTTSKNNVSTSNGYVPTTNVYTTTTASFDIVDYYRSEYDYTNSNSSDSNFKEVCKQKFISAVDFIFYDKEINGVRFSTLKTSAKAKIVYYTLLMDSKIEAKFPDYKNNLGEKYIDIKAKLIAKYMDFTVSVCTGNEDHCQDLKNDFELLKKSTSLTWTVLKAAFSYAYDKGSSALVNWYEVFSGKR